MSKKISPIHPGEVLDEEFLSPLNISQYRIAKDIGVPARRINEIVLKKRAISADTALRLGKYFKTSPQFWLNLQSRFDLEVEEEKMAAILDKVKIFHLRFSNMLHFTKYAEEKFEILNKYQVFITREQVEDALSSPDKVTKKGNYLAARKDGVKVVYSKEGEVIRVITFYPVK